MEKVGLDFIQSEANSRANPALNANVSGNAPVLGYKGKKNNALSDVRKMKVESVLRKSPAAAGCRKADHGNPQVASEPVTRKAEL